MARKKQDTVSPSEEEFRRLIPELALWNNGRGIPVTDWISSIGSFEHAIGYLALFWPDFVVHQGCVLLADSGLDNFDAFAVHGPLSAQTTMNHRHLDLYFQHDPSSTEEQMVHLGRKLRAMWMAKLAMEFPERTFVVTFDEETVTLTFFEAQPTP
jgi:hypothetical protein